ncbi:hypothetical protein K458DRAFT_459728 [Lentithecium fluviatile CBS 122367]|uniref:Uncharacterized protein n=1 Tax=Lentithecium fluviatile CBS 122367 TaxID=1168545 RepID=A0A6G1JJC8_9PLEO|nr:hypothetical protein K458DRAFT_459728 [Lentithecium fluviatile CBS 122367]
MSLLTRPSASTQIINMPNDEQTERGRSPDTKTKTQSNNSQLKAITSDMPTNSSQDVTPTARTAQHAAKTTQGALPSPSPSGLGLCNTTFSYIQTRIEKLLGQSQSEFPSRFTSVMLDRLLNEQKERWKKGSRASESEAIRAENRSRSRAEGDGAPSILPQDLSAHVADAEMRSSSSESVIKPERSSSIGHNDKHPSSAQRDSSESASQGKQRAEAIPDPPFYEHQPSEQLASQPEDNNPLSLGVPAFDYAIAPFLEANLSYHSYIEPPSLIESPTSASLSSPLTGPEPDEISVVTSVEDESFPVPNSLPPIVQNNSTFKTRLKILDVRTALIRCAVVSRTALELEQLPCKKDKTLASNEYSKVYVIADLALNTARELQSDGLQARCYYWKGRACGGQKCWNDAVHAFEKALQFDTADEELEPENRGGLTPIEKADVHFLKRSAERRAIHDEPVRRARMLRDEERAWVIADKNDQEFNAVVKWTRSPGWNPDLEDVMRQWMQRTGRKEKRIELSPVLGSDGKEKIRYSDPDNDEVKWAGRPLTQEEIDYIEHGSREAPLLRWTGGPPSPFSSPIPTSSPRRRGSRPPRINTSLRPQSLSIAVHGTADAEEKLWSETAGTEATESDAEERPWSEAASVSTTAETDESEDDEPMRTFSWSSECSPPRTAVYRPVA